jgi:hypothetical protein
LGPPHRAKKIVVRERESAAARRTERGVKISRLKSAIEESVRIDTKMTAEKK